MSGHSRKDAYLRVLQWAIDQPIARDSTKIILHQLARHADHEFRCWPSLATLIAETGKDRKTVHQGLRELKLAGLLQDTGDRRGVTKSIPVYVLMVEAVPRCGPASPPASPPKQAQISPEAGPNRGSPHLYVVEEKTIEEENPPPFANQNVHPITKAHRGRINTPPQPLPACVPADAWAELVADWTEQGKSFTTRARAKVLERLEELNAQGHNIRAVIEQTIARRWSSFHAIKGERAESSSGGDWCPKTYL